MMNKFLFILILLPIFSFGQVREKYTHYTSGTDLGNSGFIFGRSGLNEPIETKTTISIDKDFKYLTVRKDNKTSILNIKNCDSCDYDMGYIWLDLDDENYKRALVSKYSAKLISSRTPTVTSGIFYYNYE